MSLPLLALVAASAAAPFPAPTPSQQALYDLLKLRHAPADVCEQLAARTDDLPSDVAFLVEHATQPAWVAPRAAACLLRETPAAGLQAARGWMLREDRRGLALVALGELDRLPEAAAVELATLARVGPLGTSALPRIERAESEAVRAVAALPADALPASPSAAADTP